MITGLFFFAFRFMQTAEMLKPTISSIEDEIVDHFPHLLLVHNKAQMEDFTPKKFKIMQKVSLLAVFITITLFVCLRFTNRLSVKVNSV